jgi:protein-L-isoaspartate(D-aspartate) O-methyltransferase
MMALDDCRRFYAEEIQLASNISSRALIEAFASVPREDFLGPGPWQIPAVNFGVGAVKYFPTADADPRRLYHNVAVALDTARDLTNGQPATLALWIDALNLKPDECVFHLGCGVGYYTAILAEIVGSGGSVFASEVDPILAERAKANLRHYQNVTVEGGDGSLIDPGPCDAMLINAGITHVPPAWLDRLRDGGRLIFPLTVGMGMGPTLGKGVMPRITRLQDRFSVEVVSFVAIYSCTSVRDPRLEPLLSRALATGALMKMRSVRREAHDPAATCILHLPELCLSSLPLEKVDIGAA